jgi:hypothetical protein
MFEAYKVGVTLALHNQVSSVLGLIARDFVKVNAQAKALQATLKEVKLLGMGGAILGGAGFLGLGLIKATIDPAKEYVHQLERARVALANVSPGQRQLEIAQMTAAAWKTTADVMTTTPADNLKAIQELRSVFGSTSDAVKFLPQMQSIQAILDNVLHGVGGVGAKDVAFTTAKALELRGASMDVATFRTQADLITKAVIASGGKITPQMLLQAQKYGGVGATSFSNDFMWGILPTLTQELGGSSTGNSLTSMYRAIVGGHMPKATLKLWSQLGLADTSHANVGADSAFVNPSNIKGSGLFKDSPFDYVRQILMPALIAHGIKSPQDQKSAIDQLFSNRNASRIANILGMQGPRLTKDFNLIGAAGSTRSLGELMKNDPIMASKAAGAQWETLKTVIGLKVIPVLLPFLNKLAGALQSLASFANNHPTLTKGLVLTFAGLSALAAIGGTLMIAGAGIKLIGAGLGLMTGIPFAGIASGLGIFTAALAALAPIVYHQQIADAIDSTSWGKWLGDKLLGAKNFISSAPAHQGGPFGGFSPPSNDNKIQVTTNVNIDGKKVAQAVSQHQANSMNGPSTSGSGFDSRQSFVPIGVVGAW